MSRVVVDEQVIKELKEFIKEKVISKINSFQLKEELDGYELEFSNLIATNPKINKISRKVVNISIKSDFRKTHVEKKLLEQK